MRKYLILLVVSNGKHYHWYGGNVSHFSSLTSLLLFSHSFLQSPQQQLKKRIKKKKKKKRTHKRSLLCCVVLLLLLIIYTRCRTSYHSNPSEPRPIGMVFLPKRTGKLHGALLAFTTTMQRSQRAGCAQWQEEPGAVYRPLPLSRAVGSLGPPGSL